MDKSLMQFLHPDRKPNATFKLNSSSDAEFEMRALTADEMAQMSAGVQTKGFERLEALYPTIATSLVCLNLRSAELLDALPEKEGGRILSPMDALKSMFIADEIGALLSIYNGHADVTVDFGKKVEEAKNRLSRVKTDFTFTSIQPCRITTFFPTVLWSCRYRSAP